MVITQIYNEKEQAEQVKIQNVQIEGKKGTRKWNGFKSCVQGDKQIKNGIKEMVTSGKDPTLLSFQPEKRN